MLNQLSHPGAPVSIFLKSLAGDGNGATAPEVKIKETSTSTERGQLLSDAGGSLEKQAQVPLIGSLIPLVYWESSPRVLLLSKSFARAHWPCVLGGGWALCLRDIWPECMELPSESILWASGLQLHLRCPREPPSWPVAYSVYYFSIGNSLSWEAEFDGGKMEKGVQSQTR